jgi:hypothetical protein
LRQPRAVRDHPGKTLSAARWSDGRCRRAAAGILARPACRLAPVEARARTFGLFALSGKVTSFVGPWAVATITALTLDQRAGISVLILFFVAGGLLLLRVNVRGASG